MYEGHHFWGMHLFWWIAWILIVVWIFIRPWPYSKKEFTEESPLDILKRRYANGELTTEEYRERKEELEKKEES